MTSDKSYALEQRFNAMVTGGVQPAGYQMWNRGGTITTADIGNAISNGYTGMHLSPFYDWNMANVDFSTFRNFTIESRMGGDIGWSGAIHMPTHYISTGSGADGIKIYGTTTSGIVFRGCAFQGSNTNSVIHNGGGARGIKIEHCIINNTNSATGAFGFVTDTQLADNNSEDLYVGNSYIAGAYYGIGIGVNDQTQRSNDCLWHDVVTSGGIIAAAGGGHLFTNYYDRSSPSHVVVWNQGARLTFTGGEDDNLNASGFTVHRVDAGGFTTLMSRTVSAAVSGNTVFINGGTFTCRGECNANGTWAVDATNGGTIDINDSAIHGSVTITGSLGKLILAPAYAAGTRNVAGWSGTTVAG